MKGLIFLILLKCINCQYSLYSDTANWVTCGKLAVSLVNSQSAATQRFLRTSTRFWVSPTFGINISASRRHATGLRILLLVAGDVESLPGPMTCSVCKKDFANKTRLHDHIRAVHTTSLESCTQCPFTTKYRYNLKRHINDKHINPQPNKKRAILPLPSPPPEPPQPPLAKTTALKNRFASYTIEREENDPELFLQRAIPQIRSYTDVELNEKSGIKMQLVIKVQFYKPNILKKPDEILASQPQIPANIQSDDNVDENHSHRRTRWFWSTPMSIFKGTDYKVDSLFPSLKQKIDEYQEHGSGYVIEEILGLDVHFSRNKPLRGSCCTTLPKKLENTKAIINIKNKDNRCFLYCMRAAMEDLPAQSNHNRPSVYKNDHGLNFEGVEFPATLKDVNTFEKNNPGLAVNVYGYEEKELNVLRVSDRVNCKYVHLLLYDNHYFLIRDLDRLLFHLNKHKSRKWFCPRCLIHKSSKQLLTEHFELCKENEATRVKLPKDCELKFKNVHRMLRAPVIVYADLESLTEKIAPQNTSNMPTYTEKVQKHTPCGYGIQVVRNCCGEPKYDPPEVYRGPDCIEKFLLSVSQIALDHQDTLNRPAVMKGVINSADDCHICKKTIKDHKVKDHCHICGNFRGFAHNECNQSYRLSRDIVVVFHNLRKYDGHLLMDKLGTVAKLQGFGIDVIAKTVEDYISFSLKHKKEPGVKEDKSYSINFIDSVQFLNNSLEGLVTNLPKDKFKAMSTQFSPSEMKLLCRKQVYPYDYMNCWEKFSEQLPPKEEFFSILNDEGISQQDYEHAEKVWKLQQVKNMGEYHDLYLKTDVLLLADVFEEFRSFSMEKYGLDPAHYKTTPSLAIDACFKMTGAVLELFKDSDMYLFCQKGIRGGISIISHRYAKANNPKAEGYNPNEPTSYILYLDANNLYGWSMLQAMPVGSFEWVTNADWFAGKGYGYILEVDLEYPEGILHHKHSDYPLAPEHMSVDELSPYCQKLKEKLGLNLPKQKKLVPNLFHKKRYILHHKTLKLYLDLGMKLEKVHKALKFREEAWMAPFIQFNTDMRAKATSTFDKDLLKLFNNACFGKTLENVYKYQNCELVSEEARFEKLVANPRFRSCLRFNDDLVGVCSAKPSVTLNKPIYCGLTVLDLSKALMYEYYYKVLQPRYEDKLQLLFSDTDSLCVYIETADVYADLKQDAEHYDFSDYPKSNPLFSDRNKKVPGKMKDEMNGEIIDEFCGLRPKMYSIKSRGIVKKRAKGVKRSVVRRVIAHEDYKNTLLNETLMHHEMVRFRSYKHQIYTEKVSKVTLSCFDDKRWLLDSVRSRARGHFKNNQGDL